jgi:ketosteroid isomerase-like protein
MTALTTAVPLLSEFIAYIEGRRDGIFAAGATGVFHFPGHDFEVRGAKALDDLLEHARPAGSTVENLTALPTPEGFVAEVRYRTHHDGNVYETASIVRVHDGKVDRLVHYCTGASPAGTSA